MANLSIYAARLMGVLLVGLTLAGCASRPGADALTVSLDPAQGTKEVHILVATTRERADSEAQLYTAQRGKGLDFGATTISIPPKHKPGTIEWPSSPPGDPQTDFVVREARFLDGNQAFLNELNKQVHQGGGPPKNAFLFIHGYNTRLAEGAFRLAQISADNGQKSAPILFSWASGGYLTDYIYDTNSVTLARDGLQKVLMEVARSDAPQVTVLAHSLGNLLLLETLRQMKLQGIDLLANKKIVVVMAAPDVDIDVFEYMITSLGYRANPIFVLISRDDRALRLSRELAGGKERVGAVENQQKLADLGVIVIDLTDVEAQDSTNHVKFAELAQFGPQLQAALDEGQADRNAQSIGGRLTNAGRSFTQFLGDTAKIVITAPRAAAGTVTGAR